ncbi:MAG: outer membrane lipoprotein-sorting protein [Spirochaetes bacterium]|nr:outer membrane lipoprotein-sorting protein [Spirochaetota bacterium]
MKKTAAIIIILILTISFSAAAEELTAREILGKIDSVINAPKDRELKAKLILIDRQGNKKEREIVMIQKGEKRMIKFLSPASQRGIAFLNLPGNRIYLYLPAFRRVRRIASDIKNRKFAGTDFTYEDLGNLNYADEYDPVLEETTGEYFVLELKKKEEQKKEYSRLKIWVRRDNFYIKRAEYYDKNNRLRKTVEWKRIKKIGNYWVAGEIEAHDLKNDHRTKIILSEVKFDTGLKDALFTARYLKR